MPNIYDHSTSCTLSEARDHQPEVFPKAAAVEQPVHCRVVRQPADRVLIMPLNNENNRMRDYRHQLFGCNDNPVQSHIYHSCLIVAYPNLHFVESKQEYSLRA